MIRGFELAELGTLEIDRHRLRPLFGDAGRALSFTVFRIWPPRRLRKAYSETFLQPSPDTGEISVAADGDADTLAARLEMFESAAICG